jgi:predicted nucleotidyltransferase component of viral defense system
MLNKNKHQLIMSQILRDIYTHPTINSNLGFKGGTCAYLFYRLPRFSVDLDFDFIPPKKETNLFHLAQTLTKIIQKYATIKDQAIKKWTVFFLLSYGIQEHRIKIEINTRVFVKNLLQKYQFHDYLGIKLQIAKPDFMFANKLVALTQRNTLAPRDIFDINFFAKNHWDIDQETIINRTKKDLYSYLNQCLSIIENVPDNQILQGLGELVDEKTKTWIKTQLRSETIFLLKNYQSIL